MVLDVVDAVLQVTETFRQIHLQQVAQQILQVGAEVRRESNLRGDGVKMSFKRLDKAGAELTFPETIFS